jgi:hypothetical protein
MQTKPTVSFLILLSVLAGSVSCSAPRVDVRKQAYAELKTNRDFEYEFPVVWKAIEETLRKQKVVKRDPDEVNEVELRRLGKRTAETDWAYTQSRDKYFEYEVNGTPRKKYLQARMRFVIRAEKKLGAVNVAVRFEEELEKMRTDGTADGYEASEAVDSSRASELLDRINQAILASSAPPVN